MGLHPHDLTTSQYHDHWGLGFQREFWGDTNIQAMAIIKLKTILSMDELLSHLEKFYYSAWK